MDKLRLPRRSAASHDSDTSSTSSRISSFFRRSRSKSSTRTPNSETTEEIHGPLGLNLIYSPPEPQVELIFVHGLGGGSRKTWCKGDDPSLFWPKEWLPQYPTYQNVRIHSFGYDSNWSNMDNPILSVHDFGRALLTEVRNSPLVGRGDYSHNPIVLVAHSMGGIVIKKAYLLSRHDPECALLAQRFRAMIFLATPHKGTDLAGTLNNILRASVMHGTRPYISNLERNSEALEVINDEFRHYAAHLKLCSLYETKKTKSPLSGAIMVVEKDSAILGYPGEQVVLVNSNHRDICKFDDQSDPNFITVSNVVGMVVDSLLKSGEDLRPCDSSEYPQAILKNSSNTAGKVCTRKTEEFMQQIRGLGKYLGVRDKPEDDLASLEERRQPGSCEWLLHNENFRNWYTESSASPSVLLINANPATGKSVLAAYIINHLEEDLQQDCCYYFFRHGDKVKSTLCGLLLSIAFQMATFNQNVRESLLEMVEQDIRFDKDNVQVVWKRLFAISIFRAEFHRPFFWVIDALDECENGVTLLQMIQKIEQHLPIRILITSRKIQEVQAQFTAIQKHFTKKKVFSMEISESYSRQDITLYLQAHMDSLPVSNARNREKLINTILEKSAGCFLWVQLVVKELEGAFSQQHIDKVLKEVPREMGALYERALTLMAAKPADSRRYAKSILTWTMCATRPLSITELQCALKLDMDETIDSLERAIASICGQLVFVDRQMRVQMVHQTARSFLLRSDIGSEFTINPIGDHKRLAFACLTYLNSDEMKPPGIRRMGRGLIRKRSEFLNYACTSFSEHIRQSSSEDELLWQQLDWFLKTNILSWIEYIAETGNLYHMTFASKNLSHYMQRLVKYRAPLSPEVRRIKAWATDLIRLVAKFGNNILEFPSSVYALVPPFCPTESAIASQFGASGRSLVVLGLTNDAWSDQLSCIDYREPIVAVACGESCFAVGSHYGAIKLYNNATCQERKCIEQGEYVEQLEFSSSGKLLASCSYSMLKLWDVENGDLLWCQDEDTAEIMKLSFSLGDTVLLAITRKHTICSWNVSDGSLIEEVECGAIFNDESSRRPPTMAAFSPDMDFVAVAHRGRPIILWDLELRCIDGYLGREANPGQLSLGSNTSVASLVFSSDPNVPRLAAAYEDGDLAFFDPYDHALLQCTPVNAQKVASSPDGRTLATGNASGMLQLFDFETMKLLYRINGYDYSVRAIAFSSDSLRFFDVRNKMCNVWEPSVLVRRSDEDDCSSSIAPIEPLIIGIADLDEEIDITVVECHGSGDSVFCGKSDGSVVVHDIQSGNQVGTLCPTNDIPIKCLAWGETSSILATAYVAGNFSVRKVTRKTLSWDASTILLDGHSASPINELIFSLDNKLLLVSTTTCDEVWDIAEKRKLSTHDWPNPSFPFLWANNPLNPSERIQFTTRGARIFDWTHSTELTSPEGIVISTITDFSDHQPKTIITNSKTGHFAIEMSKFGYDASPVKVLVCEGSAFNVESQTISPSLHFQKLNEHILHSVGFYGTKFVFLDQKLWVCTVDIITWDGKAYIKHFFIPHDWHSCVRQLIMRVTVKGDVLFVKRDEVAIIKRGLESENLVEVL